MAKTTVWRIAPEGHKHVITYTLEKLKGRMIVTLDEDVFVLSAGFLSSPFSPFYILKNLVIILFIYVQKQKRCRYFTTYTSIISLIFPICKLRSSKGKIAECFFNFGVIGCVRKFCVY